MHADEKDWAEKAKGILRAEMVRRGVNYAQLVEKLGAIGVTETEANLRNKVSRGSFTAAFLIQCFSALGASVVRLEEPS